jgi:hypothetical protein
MNQTRLVDGAKAVGDDEDDGAYVEQDGESSGIGSVRREWHGEAADAFNEAHVAGRKAEKLRREICDSKYNALGSRGGDGRDWSAKAQQGMGAVRRQAGEAGSFIGIGWLAGRGAALNGFDDLHSVTRSCDRASECGHDASFADAGVGARDKEGAHG